MSFFPIESPGNGSGHVSYQGGLVAKLRLMLRTSLFLVRERERFGVFDDRHEAGNHLAVVDVVVVVVVEVRGLARHGIVIAEGQ